MKEQEQIFAYKELRNNGQAFFIDNYEDADRIIKALEKQVPKKPIGNSCPICGADFCSKSWERDYCCLCGQKLKWGDEE